MLLLGGGTIAFSSRRVGRERRLALGQHEMGCIAAPGLRSEIARRYSHVPSPALFQTGLEQIGKPFIYKPGIKVITEQELARVLFYSIFLKTACRKRANQTFEQTDGGRTPRPTSTPQPTGRRVWTRPRIRRGRGTVVGSLISMRPFCKV